MRLMRGSGEPVKDSSSLVEKEEDAFFHLGVNAIDLTFLDYSFENNKSKVRPPHAKIEGDATTTSNLNPTTSS